MICKMMKCRLSAWLVRQAPDPQKCTCAPSSGPAGLLEQAQTDALPIPRPWSLALRGAPAWFPLARTCISLPFLVPDICTALLCGRPEVPRNWSRLPTGTIGYIAHSFSTASPSLFHLPAPPPVFPQSSRSAPRMGDLVSESASGGTQAQTIIFSQRSSQLNTLAGFEMPGLPWRTTSSGVLCRVEHTFSSLSFILKVSSAFQVHTGTLSRFPSLLLRSDLLQGSWCF